MSDCSAGAQKSSVGPALPREIGENENDMCARRGARCRQSDEIQSKGVQQKRTFRIQEKKENSASRGCKTPAADLVVTRTAGRHGPHSPQPPTPPHPSSSH